ncbi:OmpH family outer membrane protein [Pedobacter arcticus]|uniref:OmpH family outer membrane protein n=1 Tax=Pedobacter arcticus TaxID=752140 RepID=UPI0003031BA5|nr:OmpH family outer membrane protein [Pedobacter arcticus]
MNKIISKIAQAGTGLAFMAAVVACNNPDSKTANTASSTSTKENKTVTHEFVYVNSDSLLSKYDYFKEMNGRLENKSKKAEADLKDKGTAFQREVAAYQQGANTMSADQRQKTEERLARKQQELQGFQQNAGAALQNEQATESEKLYDKVADYLKGYAKQKGYKMVLTYSKANPTILFADESLDVTTEVIKGLNEAYKKDKK